MGLASRTLWTLRRYWADCLGVPPEGFNEHEVTVGRAEEGGIQLFWSDDCMVIGAPDTLVDNVTSRSNTIASTDLGHDASVREWLTSFDGIDQVFGPTFYGYADRETFSPAESDARVLRAADSNAFQTLRSSVPEEEWEQAGIEFTPGETVGFFVAGELAAVAGYTVWDGLIAHLAVVTHPEHRGQGYGQVVVSHATEQSLAAGLIPQYRTSDSWPWSVELAQQIGFQRFTTGYLGVCHK